MEQIHPMQFLNQKLGSILDVVPKGSKIVFLDYPLHNNIGDLLIMNGTEKFFSENGIQVIGSYNVYDYCPEIQFSSDIILVFHGGGNLGDLYPKHQKMREDIIQQHTNNRIVILPQTIYFQNKQNLKRAFQIFRQHPGLHIFTRDKKSFEIAKNNLHRNVYLSPDMTHALWPIKNDKTPKLKCLFLLRTDIEMLEGGELSLDLTHGNNLMDWPDLFNSIDNAMVEIFAKVHKLNTEINIFPTRFFWRVLSQRFINKSINLFSRYQYIITSRLHGHILACLMGIPNRLLDNSYGKNYNYYNSWTYKVDYATFEECKND